MRTLSMSASLTWRDFDITFYFYPFDWDWCMFGHYAAAGPFAVFWSIR